MLYSIQSPVSKRLSDLKKRLKDGGGGGEKCPGTAPGIRTA